MNAPLLRGQPPLRLRRGVRRIVVKDVVHSARVGEALQMLVQHRDEVPAVLRRGRPAHKQAREEIRDDEKQSRPVTLVFESPPTGASGTRRFIGVEAFPKRDARLLVQAEDGFVLREERLDSFVVPQDVDGLPARSPRLSAYRLLASGALAQNSHWGFDRKVQFSAASLWSRRVSR